MNPTSGRHGQRDASARDGSAEDLPDPDGREGTSALQQKPSQAAETLEALDRKVRDLAGSSTTSPVVQDIARVVSAIRRSPDYQAWLRGGTAAELKKLVRRLLVVVDIRSRWTALEQWDRADAEGLEAIAQFFKALEELVDRSASELQSPWAREAIVDGAAMLAHVVSKRMAAIMEVEVIHDGRTG